MKLRLSLTNSAPGRTNCAATWECTPCGGTIGRSSNDDWVLPDPTKVVSRHHAEIQFMDGGFSIVDQSRNGVFLNDAELPIGEGRTAPLRHGDRLRIGDFEILAEVDAERPLPLPLPETAGDNPVIPWDFGKTFDTTEQDHGLETFGTTEQDHGVDIHVNQGDLGRITESIDPEPEDDAPPTSPTLPSERTDDHAPPDLPAGGTGPNPLPQVAARPDWDHPAPPSAAANGMETALAALLAGAGVPSLQVPGGPTPELFRLIGEIFARYAAGSVELVRAISKIKNTFRIEQTQVQNKGNNPLRWVHPSEAVERLLVPSHSGGYLPPAAAVADTMDSVIAHQMGVIKGMEAAFQSFLRDELAPEVLARRFDAQGGPGFFTIKKAWYWEQYAKHYQKIVEEAEDDYLVLLGRAFLDEYERQVRPIRERAKVNGAAAGND